MPQNKPYHCESGNVFIFILLGVVLFAALSFSIARGFNSSGTSAMSTRQAELAASNILDYASQISRAVDRARRKGCSENEISFENKILTIYTNPNTTTGSNCYIFSSEGGPVTFWDTISAGIHQGNAGNPGAFFERSYFSGSIMHHPDAGAADIVDLTMWLPDIGKSVCLAINKQLGITNLSGDTPDATAEDLGGSTFTGTFGTGVSDSREIRSAGGELENQMSGCAFIETDNASLPPIYAFYSVLLAR